MRALGPGPVTMAPAQMPLNDLNMPPQTTIGIPGQAQVGLVSIVTTDY